MMAYLLLILLICSTDGTFVFNAERDVKFLLLTRRNVNTSQQLVLNDVNIINTFFNPNLPTRFLIHGFLQGPDADINLPTARALLRRADLNVVFVDWSMGAQTINYFEARARVTDVARFTASFIDTLHINQMLNFKKLSIIGFSLGAHIAGLTGKQVTKGHVNTIIGLDPAGPLFDINNRVERLAIGDAEYVECIHTNGFGTVLGSFGIGATICDANFYPNGVGRQQPGCQTNICSHTMAITFFIESVINNKFWANKCQSGLSTNRQNCKAKPGAYMGGEPSNYGRNVKGVYYLETNGHAYGQGKW